MQAIHAVQQTANSQLQSWLFILHDQHVHEHDEHDKHCTLFANGHGLVC